MSTFTKRFMEITGATTFQAGALIFSMNEFMEKNNIRGTFLETGVYFGRSGAIYLDLDNVTDGILVDSTDRFIDTDFIDQFKTPYIFVNETSESYLESDKFKSLIKDKELIHLHLDASHLYENVKSELVNLLPHVSESGLVCLDDWNFLWPQVSAAYYDVWFNYDFGWKFLLHGFNKAFLCHENHFPEWNDYILTSLVKSMKGLGIDKCQLCRTDVHPDCSAFHLRELTGNEAKGDDLPFYGSWARKIRLQVI